MTKKRAVNTVRFRVKNLENRREMNLIVYFTANIKLAVRKLIKLTNGN